MHIYNYLICAIAQMILAAIAWKSAYMDTRKNKLYIASIVFNIIVLLGYAGRGIFNDGSHYMLNYVVNTVIYLSGSLLTYFVLLTTIKRNGTIYKMVTILEILVLLFISTSPWTHLAFYIDGNGLYQRGVLYSAVLICHSFFAMLWIGVLAVIYRNVEFKKRIFILLLGILELSAIILQMFASEFKVIYVSAAFLLEIYYVFMMEVEGRYDQMTGVYSKRYYYSEIDRLSSISSYIVFMLDANGLKFINDNMGHEYGNLVIKTVGQTAWSIMNSKSKIFRIGGDEFVGFSTSINEKDMKKYIDEINNKLEIESKKLGFDVAASVGYAVHVEGEDFQSTLHRADESMYKAKNNYYKKTGKKRRV